MALVAAVVGTTPAAPTNVADRAAVQAVLPFVKEDIATVRAACEIRLTPSDRTQAESLTRFVEHSGLTEDDQALLRLWEWRTYAN